jgi:hypothetical protein
MKINNKEIETLDKEMTPVVRQAVKLEISNSADMKSAVEILSTINKYADTVKEKKESITKPLTLAIKNTRLMFAPLESKLEEAIGSLRSSMTSYQTQLTRKAQEEEERIAARVGEGKGKIKVETAVKKMEEIEKPDAVVVTDEGLVKFREVKKFKIVDVSKIPLEFMMPNEVEIRKSMMLGVRIDGVEYYSEQVPYNTR